MKPANLFVFVLSITLLVSFSVLSAQSEAEQETQKASQNKEETKEQEPAPEQEVGEDANTEGKVESAIRLERSKIKIAPPVALDKQQKSDLSHYISKSELSPVLVGPDELITLVQDSSTRNNKGVVIFIPDWQQSPVSPKAINFLRNSLPAQGWVTIAMQATNKPSNYPSQAEKASEQAEENQKTLADYQESFTAKLEAVLKKAKEYPGLVLIASAGNHAGLLFDIFQQGKIESPSGVMILSGFMLTEVADKTFAHHMASSEFPVFDILLRNDHPLVFNSARQRKIYADKEMKVYYRQRQLNNFSSGYYPDQALLKEINGWLKSIGW